MATRKAAEATHPAGPATSDIDSANAPEVQPDDRRRGELAIHFLDVGREEYGDSVLCQFGDTSVLIDGAHPGNHEDEGARHPSIPKQVADLLGQDPSALRVSLLVVTHAHQDHIGCLPRLVADGVLTADWALVADPLLGWGKSSRDAVGFDAGVPDDVARLAAALREETLAPETDAATFERFVADAATLEQRYREMVEQLEAGAAGHVVRYRGNNARAVEQAFAHVGLRVLGPSEEQVLRCARVIRGRSTDLLDAATGALRAADARRAAGDAGGSRLARAYRRAAGVAADAPGASDVAKKDKGAINNQSIVTRFSFRGAKLLFTGDMQFEEPEVSDRRIHDEIASLRRSIQRDGPFALVKLAHHGSYNGFSEDLLAEVGGALSIGICAGEGSTHHPNPTVLEVLGRHEDAVEWARTDRNGRSTFTLRDGGPRFEVTRGHTNDPTPNVADVSGGASPVPPVPPAVPPGPPSPPGPAGGGAGGPVGVIAGEGVAGRGTDFVDVMARLLQLGPRVSVTFSVERGGPRAGGAGDVGPFDAAGRGFRLAGGHPLPALLFVTDRDALAANIGSQEAAAAIEAVRAAGHNLVDRLPSTTDVTAARAVVRSALGGAPREVAGVVLLGGYDVVPSQRLDCLPARVRQQLPADAGDPDDFVVWNDDAWVDLDGDGIAELPVSRIPDGKSSELVRRALDAQSGSHALPRSGIRNVARPFADGVFAGLPGGGVLLRSHPTRHDVQPPFDLSAERVYLMLHGSDQDGTRFWGETANGYLEAVNLRSITDWQGRVVFTGCCWGALPVDTPAARAQPGRPLGVRPPGASLALHFLRNGALAFVGCTGAHYSPTDPAQGYNYFGGPMHRAFWAAYGRGRSPAAALFEAKREYMRAIPHGQWEIVAQAIEFKILGEYTCLGLGWFGAGHGDPARTVS